MATTNLGLETINSSDYISPEPINQNMEKLDKLGVDYITESGTSGEWWYRKWNSGRAECGIDCKKFAEKTPASLSSSSGLYYAGTYTFGAYPFAFASRPYTSITFEGDDNMSDRVSFVVTKQTQSTTASPYFSIVDTTTVKIAPYCGIYVCGSWK
jgi:hypothetical protein